MPAFLLENERVKLIPLAVEHYEQLLPLSKEVDLYQYGASDVSTPDKLKAYIIMALDRKAQGTALSFIIYDKEKKLFAGSTRFGLIDHEHKLLHIGWTWLGENFRGSGLNTHVKFLMLRYAFETMKMEKVEFRIDERNLRSRRAVEKIGGVLEGVLRKSVIVKGGFRRSSACYGILKEEWPQLKTLFFNRKTKN